MLMYRGEKRKLAIDLTASLNGATASNLTVTLHRARGMADVSESLLTDDPAAPTLRVEEGSTFADVWVDLASWTERGRFKVRVQCDADSNERPVERTLTLLVQ